MSHNRTCPRSTSNLCDRCQFIDIGHLLDPSIDVGLEGIHIATLGKPGSKAFEDGCSLCELFLSVAPPYKRRLALELRLFDRIPDNEDAASDPSNRFLAVTRRNKRLVYDHKTIHEIGSCGLLVSQRAEDGQQGPVSIVKSESVSYGAVKEWLANCISFHGSSCNRASSPERIPDLLVIDCMEGQLVPLKQHADYVTLSYVWGPHLKEREGNSRCEIDEHDSDMPATIRDAISVVKQISHRYLWVDRYCIPQHEGRGRHHAITNMHQIYAGAVMTLVTLYGDGAHAGLPGVSQAKRTTIQQASNGTGTLVSTFPPLPAVVQESLWSTRGWTYQEARLSRRCLFFTEHQVYFSCQKSSCSEAVHGSSTSPVVSQLNTASLGGQILAKRDRHLNFGLFLDRFTYSQRSLSYQKDGLDAFRGILRLHPYVSLWGVPIARIHCKLDPCVGFAMGLLWTRRPEWVIDYQLADSRGEGYGRRADFPTWSWASIEGHIYQDCHQIARTTYQKFIDQNVFWDTAAGASMTSDLSVGMRVPGGKLISLPQAIDLFQQSVFSNTLPEESRSLTIEGDMVKVKRGIGKDSFYICAEDGSFLKGDGEASTRFDLEYDVDGDEVNGKEQHDALVLVEWDDNEPRSNTRFVLMLLRWVEDGVAERVGLMGEYHVARRKSFVDIVPRRRVTFELR